MRHICINVGKKISDVSWAVRTKAISYIASSPHSSDPIQLRLVIP